MVDDLVQRVGRTVAQRKLFGRERRILVAVSGGLDSMVLLRVLGELAPSHGWTLGVAHLNHGLRGRASDGDESLVRRTAERLGFKFVSERADVKGLAKAEGLSMEMAARRLRHEFLARSARKLRMRVVALGHHADDQVELFFLRLLRGAGSEGLSGMDWRGPSPADKRLTLTRPLMEVTRADLEEFARSTGLKWREDATNASQEILRNRVRHELLPLLKTYQPALSKVILRQMEILGAEGDFVETAAKAWLREGGGEFEKLPIAVQRRCMMLRIRELSVIGDFEMIEQLRTTTRPVTLPGGLVLTRTKIERGGVRLSQIEPFGFSSGFCEVALSPAGELDWAGVRFHWAIEPLASGKPRFPASPGSERFDAQKVGPKVNLRHWQPGDRFQPIGMVSAVKLQDLWVNLKIPRTERASRILATTGQGEVFWVEGLRIGERFKLDKTTRQQLKWSWDRL